MMRKQILREKKAKKKGQEQWQKKRILPKDEGLQGNETIEEAILELQKEPTPELLAHVLTVIRRRMKEGGQAILSVEPPSGDESDPDRNGKERRRKSLVGRVYEL